MFLLSWRWPIVLENGEHDRPVPSSGGTDHSSQPPCCTSSSAFSMLMDLQNSLVRVSHNLARPSL